MKPYVVTTYLMHWREGGCIQPLYVGCTGKFRSSGGKICENLLNIRGKGRKFARWGTDYARHIGALSAASCLDHNSSRITRTYSRWAERLFTDAPSLSPTLRRPTYFWATAWGPDSPNIWPEYGSSSLSFQESLLIGVASDLFPAILLNEKGANRVGPQAGDATDS